jgi:hypothetical protein
MSYFLATGIAQARSDLYEKQGRQPSRIRRVQANCEKGQNGVIHKRGSKFKVGPARIQGVSA